MLLLKIFREMDGGRAEKLLREGSARENKEKSRWATKSIE